MAEGIGAHADAVRLFAAAERARTAVGIDRVPPEREHWAAIDGRLRSALGDDAYEAARTQDAELSPVDALVTSSRTGG